MRKTGKWIKNFLIGKKEKEKDKNGNNHQQLAIVARAHPTTPVIFPPTTPKEKKRWSFRRSSASAPGQKDSNASVDISGSTPPGQNAESDEDQKKHALAMAAATAAAADAAVAAAKAAVAVIQLSAGRVNAVDEDAAATRIQCYYRGYLARKALNALRGLVKLQALVRGHLVRKQAAATLRCMQALVTVQARARAQRLRMVEEPKSNYQSQFNHRYSTHDNRSRHSSYQDFDRAMEGDIKIVEMDHGDSRGSVKSRSSYSSHGQIDRYDNRIPTYRSSSKQEQPQISPSPSVITDMSPKASSGHFEEYSIGTAQSSPHYLSAISKPDPSSIPFDYPRSEYADSLCSEYPFYPSYMANTESSRAKVRSHSAPKQRPETFERQPSVGRRRPSIEGRNVPRGMKMQRSSSHVGSTAQNYHYPWSIKLDRSTVSLIESECGSTSTVLTNPNYCRSLVGFEVHGSRY